MEIKTLAHPHERLAISDGEDVVMLYVPSVDSQEHWHIALSIEGLRDLHDFTGKAMAARGIGSSVLKEFFKEIEYGPQEHREWLAEKFKKFWGVEVKPRFDGDIPE